ncbi:MAG: transcriptional repressor [Oscillospiraceae bacterium]|nr:transcriptional repressor [Oscillospiraceae bacterium]MDD4545887.1 transcriptional repressor [Oscillospiraceae bacterium]
MAAIRNTKQKQLIFSLLEDAGHPLTASEVYEHAKRLQPSIAKSTIYRNLEAMLSRGEVAHGMLKNGEGYYSVVDGQKHQHYMICKSCNNMLDIPKCPLSEMERDIAKTFGFFVTDHTLQIYGYCNECRNKNK